MKTLLKTLSILLLFTFIVSAQTFDAPKIYAEANGLTIDFGMASSTLDSVATDISAPFSLADYDASDGDVFTLYTDLNTAAGNPKTTFTIYGCETVNGTYVSLDAILSNSATNTATYTPFDIADKRAKFYKLYITNEATGRPLTGYHVKIRASKRDF